MVILYRDSYMKQDADKPLTELQKYSWNFYQSHMKYIAIYETSWSSEYIPYIFTAFIIGWEIRTITCFTKKITILSWGIIKNIAIIKWKI